MLNLNQVAQLGPEMARVIDELGLALTEQRATLADRAIYDRLLTELVMKYVHAERELQSLNDLKNKFLGMAAHDLRNPLAAIRSLSDLLLDMELDDAQRKEFLQAIRDSSDQMMRLVSDLLDVSVIESGKMEIRFQKVSLGNLVRERLKVLRFAAEKKGIQLEATIDENAWAMFDHDRFGQVVDNLVSNAIKFSPSGSVVHIGIARDERAIQLTVRDRGPGFSAEDKQKLFGAFQKLSARPTGGEKSTGLGLAIVKKIVDAHRGTINVTSEPGAGAEFCVSIPVGDAE